MYLRIYIIDSIFENTNYVYTCIDIIHRTTVPCIILFIQGVLGMLYFYLCFVYAYIRILCGYSAFDFQLHYIEIKTSNCI